MWASLKNYSIIPKGPGGAGAYKRNSDELPFSVTFSLRDQKELLNVNGNGNVNLNKNKKSSNSASPQHTYNKVKANAARRKLMLAVTEDAECFRFLQFELRQRGILTHMATEQVLRSDVKLLKTLTSKILSKGDQITLSKELQVQHHIISKATATAMNKDNFSNTGSSLLHNLKGLIIQQEECEEDCDDDDEEDGEPRNKHNYTAAQEEPSMRAAPAPTYVVVSPPSRHTNNCNKRGSNKQTRSKSSSGALPKFLSVTHSTTTRGSMGTTSSSSSFLTGGCGANNNHAHKHQHQRVFGHARRMGSITTTSPPSVRGSITARGSLASAVEWLALPTVLRSNASEPVLSQQSRVSWHAPPANNHHQQINMSSRQMSESLQNSLQNVANSNHILTSTGRSSNMRGFYEGSFDDSQELELDLELPIVGDTMQQQSPSPRAAKTKTKKSPLKAALNRTRCDSTTYVTTTEKDAQDQLHKLQSNKQASLLSFDEFLARNNNCATNVNCGYDSDDYDDQSALLVSFPSKIIPNGCANNMKQHKHQQQSRILANTPPPQVPRANTQIQQLRSSQQTPTSNLRAARGA
jgi:hypothetical protein